MGFAFNIYWIGPWLCPMRSLHSGREIVCGPSQYPASHTRDSASVNIMSTEPIKFRMTAVLRSHGFRLWPYSHSMVPGGLLVISNTTRLTSGTSFTMRFDILASVS